MEGKKGPVEEQPSGTAMWCAFCVPWLPLKVEKKLEDVITLLKYFFPII
jgi:hypothetical protein